MKRLIMALLGLFLVTGCFAQCNQHVFSSVGADKWTNFQYQDCDGLSHYFGLPTGGYTVIFCAEIGTTFVLNGDGFVYPLITEHPAYPSCLASVCPSDINEDGYTNLEDLLIILQHYGAPCPD